MLTPADARAIEQAVGAALGTAVIAGESDVSAVDGVLARAFAERDGLPLYPTPLAKAAVVFCRVAADGPYGRLNAPMALALAATGLARHGYELRVEPEETVKFMQAVALGFTSWHRVSIWLKAHLVRVQKPYGGVAGTSNDQVRE